MCQSLPRVRRMRSRVCVVCVCGESTVAPSSHASSSCFFPPFPTSSTTRLASCRLSSHRRPSATGSTSCLRINASSAVRNVLPSTIHSLTCDRIGSSLHTIACCSTPHHPEQHHHHQLTDQSSCSSMSKADVPPPGFAARPAATTTTTTGSNNSSRPERQASVTSSTDSSNGWLCVVCCQKVPSPARKQLFAIGPCDHPVCAVCSTKMRVLCDQDECPICRQEITKVMFTSKRDQKYASINFNEIRIVNPEYQIYFEDEGAERVFSNLLLHPCRICKNHPPDSHPDRAAFFRSVDFKTLKELDAHLRREHELFLCDLCVENLRIFSNERKYYTRRDLVRHKRTGDPDDSSHRGHPLCRFCDVRFMDDEDLHRHLRKDHYYCHFCDPLGLSQFFDSYNNLRDHYSKSHFLCEEGSCREERFTSVFRSDIDLQAHRATTHCTTRTEAKEARILSIDFSLTPRSNQPQISANVRHESGFEGRGGSRGMASGRGRRAPPGLARGAVGGHHDEESDEGEASAVLVQEVPKPEDFPSLAHLGSSDTLSAAVVPPDGRSNASTEATAASAAAATSSSSTSAHVRGKAGPSTTGDSYGELAERFKGSTPKLSSGARGGGKDRSNGPSFSSRIGGGSAAVMARSEDDFPALCSASIPCPVGSSLSSFQKRELGRSSAYATLSSVAAAVAHSVPKVVSKVATATCLPSSSTGASSLMTSCAPSGAGGSKSLSTQSLISSAPSLRSAHEFPSLPVSQTGSAPAAKSTPASRSKGKQKQQQKQQQQPSTKSGKGNQEHQHQQQQQQLNQNSSRGNRSAGPASAGREDHGIRNPGFAGSDDSFPLLVSKSHNKNKQSKSSSQDYASKLTAASAKQTKGLPPDLMTASNESRTTGASSSITASSSSSSANNGIGISRTKSSVSSSGSSVPTRSGLEQISRSLLNSDQEFPGLALTESRVRSAITGGKKGSSGGKKGQSVPSSGGSGGGGGGANADRIVVSSNIVRKVNPGTKLNPTPDQNQENGIEEEKRSRVPAAPPGFPLLPSTSSSSSSANQAVSLSAADSSDVSGGSRKKPSSVSNNSSGSSNNSNHHTNGHKRQKEASDVRRDDLSLSSVAQVFLSSSSAPSAGSPNNKKKNSSNNNNKKKTQGSVEQENQQSITTTE